MACPFANPHQLFGDLATVRKTDGLPRVAALSGAYVVSRHADIVTVLDDPDTYSSRPTVPEFPPPAKAVFAGRVPERGTLLAHDNPDHDRLRRAVASFFVPRRLARFEPLLHNTAHALIDQFVAAGETDIKSAFALPLPLRTIVAIAGLDPERWQWIGQGLALFGGITQDVSSDDGETTSAGRTVQQRMQDVLDLHDYVASVIEARRTDRRDDLISHIWNQRCPGGAAETMTDHEHLSMIPGLLLAGHETTTSLLSMGIAHLLHNNLWHRANRDDASRAATIEELLRYESAITAMPRAVTRPTTLAGVQLNPGDQLFVAYNSGSRDAPVSGSENLDMLDIDRPVGAVQHLGFGRGIHACLGAPLARLLLRTEFKVLHERLPGLRLVTAYDEIPYKPVGFTRGVEKMVLAWDPPAILRPIRDVVESQSHVPATTSTTSDNIHVLVLDKATIAEGVVQLTLVPDPSKPSPSFPRHWTSGAHIDLYTGAMPQADLEDLSPADWRQYSISALAPPTLQIAVLRQGQHENDAAQQTASLPTKSTGSRYISDKVQLGDSLIIRGPRNHFLARHSSVSPSATGVESRTPKKQIFIAGGIGITPIRPLAADARAKGNRDYELVYLGRTRTAMAYVDEMELTHGDRATVWVSSEQQHHVRENDHDNKCDKRRYDLETLLLSPEQALEVYCCGPESLLSNVEGLMQRRREQRQKPNADVLHMERFANPALAAVGGDGVISVNRPFEIVMARSGKILQVPADKSVLDIINQEADTAVASTTIPPINGDSTYGDASKEAQAQVATRPVLSTCGKGLCGTCEIPVLEGVPEHRDAVLTPLEKAAGTTMMACVSRCRGSRLVLDLW